MCGSDWRIFERIEYFLLRRLSETDGSQIGHYISLFDSKKYFRLWRSGRGSRDNKYVILIKIYREHKGMIRFVLMINKQGQTRLAKYFSDTPLEERIALEGELVRKCLSRTEKHVNYFRTFRIVLRIWARSLQSCIQKVCVALHNDGCGWWRWKRTIASRVCA